MKKHKSVVAILLAVMMIFTMMPMMAFAADGSEAAPSWDGSYSSVTIGGKTYTNVKKVWKQSNGKVLAKLDWTDYEADSGAVMPAAEIEYWDFSNTAITGKGTWSNAKFASAYDPDTGEVTGFGLTVDKPANLKVDPAATTTTPVPFNDGDFEVTYTASGFDPNSWDAQDVTISANAVPAGEGEDTASPEYVGTVTATKVIKVEAKVATPDAVEYFVDKAKSTQKITGVWGEDYDGASHKIINSEVPGVTVTYELQNSKTKAYEAVNAVEFKDAGKYYARATAVNPTTKAKKVTNFTITVDAVEGVVFDFDKSEYKVKEGVEYDAYDFVEPTAEGAAKAVAANKAELMAWFKDNYEITEEPNKYDETKITLGFKAKEVDEKAMAAKYEALLNNFGTPTVALTDTADLEIVPKTAYYEIEFKNSPTTKSYKAKVLKKKAKSFKVHAECTTGETVNYKLINAPAKITINKTTGKITLKKGLKKGTYKIIVKAYVPLKGSADAGYNGETHEIKIKVKK